MKHWNKRVMTAMTAAAVLALSSLNVLAVQADFDIQETKNGAEDSQEGNQAEVNRREEGAAEGSQEENTEIELPGSSEYTSIWIDASDMIYRAGGWGTPVDKGWSTYALTEREKLKEEILDAIQQNQYYINVERYNLTVEDAEEIKILYAELLNEHPELFYVSSGVRCDISPEDGRMIFLVWYCRENSEEEKQRFADKLWKVASLVDDNMTDLEKALFLHDYLAQHCAYAYRELLDGTQGEGHIPDAYGALVDGKTICQGYAEAYKALLNTVGIKSELCGSSAMNHAWNVVYLDGNWYHVDVTWDDPVWNREGRVGHTYFLLSDEEVGNRGHHDWEASVECAATDYDSNTYWWNSVNSQIVLADDKYYYLKSGFDWDPDVYVNVCKLLEKDGDEVTEVYSQEVDTWDENYQYIPFDSYLTKEGDYLYFNDRTKLYAMKLTDAEPMTVYTYEGGEDYICGAMVYEDGTARLNIFSNSGEESDEYITIVPNQPESDSVRSFVFRMYTVALGRAAEVAGFRDWTSRLLNHEIDGAGIANGFIMSDEFKNKNVSDSDYVDILYRTFFDREADQGGKATWVEALANGNSRVYVLAGFVNSVEFDNLCSKYSIIRGIMEVNEMPAGSGIRQFVERCYNKVLGRVGEKAGVDDWTSRIARGEQTPESTAKLFFFSDEYLDKHTSDEEFVEALYQTFMDRSSDPAGKADWVGRLAGGMSRQEVLEGFSRSAEFAEIMKSFGM